MALGFIYSLTLRVSLRLEVGSDLTECVFLTVDRRGLRMLSALSFWNVFCLPNHPVPAKFSSPLQPEAEFCRVHPVDTGDHRERNAQGCVFYSSPGTPYPPVAQRVPGRTAATGRQATASAFVCVCTRVQVCVSGGKKIYTESRLLTMPLIGWVTLGKSLNFSETSFP